MNLGILDWSIVILVLAGMFFSVSSSKGLMRSVTDFLVAGRSAGRYMMSISSGVAGLGAITIVNYMEMNYIAGFSMSWWGMTSALVILFITVSGWVIYRFRQTRCLTLAQFFEQRYSRKFRIFTGIVAFSAGLINFGIFPAVGARFFIYFCGIPQTIPFLGIDLNSYALLMILLLSISLYFVFTGGQIAVILADFFQGVFVNIVFVVMIIFLFFYVDWGQVHSALADTPKKEAQMEIVQLESTEEFNLLPVFEQEEKITKIKDKHENTSRINPFKTNHVEDFNFWYFLIGIIGVMYGTMSWQGTQAYNASARSAHEAKMGSVLAGWRGLPQTLFFLFVPVLAYTVMNHADYFHISESVNTTLATLKPDAIQSQMRVPLILSHILPMGLMGAFAAVMLAAFVSTHDTYLHSWGSILIQDVIMPFRKQPFSPEMHLKVLRISIVFVAIFIFLFSLLFQQNQKIALFFAITGAIFAGGSGAVIIGGLYWKRGTTAAAWAAMSTGAIIAVVAIVLKQVSQEWLADTTSISVIKNVIIHLRNINGQMYWGIGMGASSLIYVVVSLFGKPSDFNIDKLLQRGDYLNKDETHIVNANPEKGWKILGMGKEFTMFDKFIYILNYVWTFGWTIVFIIGTDIGGTTFSSAVFSQDLTLQATSDKCRTSNFYSTANLLDAIANQITVLSENLSISGVGFACPGPLDAGNGTIFGTPNLTLLENCHIKKEMEKRLNLPCLIENDANLFALGECWEYSGKKDIFTGITLGTGLGFGIIINGQLFTGAHGMAAEYGISPVQWGKWETAISIDGIISPDKENRGVEITPRDLKEMADKGDRTALIVWNDFGVKLGTCLTHLINMLDPDAISIGGGMSHAFVHFKRSMTETIKNHSPAYNHYTIDIFESVEKEISAKRGAAMLLISS